MPALPKNVYPVAAVRRIDAAAIERGISGYELMNRAADAVVEAVSGAYPGARRWVVVCGAGNNAGDGYEIARRALASGRLAAVLAVADPGALKGDAARAHRAFVDAGGTVAGFEAQLPDGDLIVDALLGSGLSRDVDGRFRDAVEAMNGHDAPVVAVDLPSGLDGDSGRLHGVAVKAKLTVTFVGLKPGLFLADGPDAAGDLLFGDLGIPDECASAETPVLECVSAADLERWLPRRPRSSHKGDFGHVFVVGGAPGMPGAALLTASAALRAGAGRVTLATHAAHAAAIVSARPELMSLGVDDAGRIASTVGAGDVLAVGPGLGRGDWAGALCASLAPLPQPAVWDADALNWLAAEPGFNEQRVITPHPGEAARLLGCDNRTIQQDRVAAVDNLQRKFGGVAVLKGAMTLVRGPERRYVCSAGNPGMASPGMGDALTGIIAALVAQGLPLELAAVAGVVAHAAAGDAAARAGQRGLLAGDLIDSLRDVVNP